MKTRSGAAGMVLLEVVLASALFAMAAMAVLVSLHSCFRSLNKMTLEAQASDLAVTKTAEVHIGILPPENDGPNEYEEDEDLLDWTWEIVAEDIELEVETEAPPMIQVKVIITNLPTGYTYTTQFLTPTPPEPEDGEDGEELAGGIVR